MHKPTKIIVAFSGGKDSLATLDLCARNFEIVGAFFMYWVKGLNFQEVIMQWAERTYGVPIARVPHFDLPWTMSSQMFAPFRPSYPVFRRVKMREVQDLMRGRFRARWIASGEKMCDSFTRRFMMKASGQWDQKRFVYYPLMFWTNRQVFRYLRLRHIPLPPEYRFMKGSWGAIRGSELYQVKRHFPEDYQRILEVFPFAEAVQRRYELYGKNDAQENQSAEI